MTELRQIHHVKTIRTHRYVEDENGMMQKRPVERYARSDHDRIVYGETGETFEVAADGSFFVPVDVAVFFLRQPDWYEGPSPFAPEPVEERPRAVKARKPAAAAVEE